MICSCLGLFDPNVCYMGAKEGHILAFSFFALFPNRYHLILIKSNCNSVTGSWSTWGVSLYADSYSSRYFWYTSIIFKLYRPSDIHLAVGEMKLNIVFDKIPQRPQPFSKYKTGHCSSSQSISLLFYAY